MRRIDKVIVWILFPFLLFSNIYGQHSLKNGSEYSVSMKSSNFQNNGDLFNDELIFPSGIFEKLSLNEIKLNKESNLQKTYPELDSKFKSYEVLSINSSKLVEDIKSSKRSEIIVLSLDETRKWNLILNPSNIISPNYKSLIATDNGIEEITFSDALPMKGMLDGMESSKVSLTFNHNFIYGFVNTGVDYFYIEPLYHFVKNAPYDKFVLYNSRDIIYTSELKCGVEEAKSERMRLKSTIRNSGERLDGNCYVIQFNTASDYLMFSHYGSSTAVQNHNLGVLNDVQNNYDDEFADEIQFEMGQQWISTCSTCDPWTSSTNPSTLLLSFKNWAPTGFTQSHDLASLWTRRDLDGSTIGIAYVDALCTILKYNVLQDFTSNAEYKRNLMAHEVGHNFGANHDAAGSSYIMVPAVNGSNTWSSASIIAIEDGYNSATCLETCGVNVTVPTNVQASDGTYSDKVVVTWSGTTGNYFRVYRNTTNNTSSATALGSWQTSTTYNDVNATPNVTYYYWVKAASDASGSNASAFSTYNTGWRSGVTVPTNVQASDGTYSDKVVVTWSGTTGNYFRVYRNTTNNTSSATALGSWQTSTTYNDVSATPNVTYYYWVKAASDANGSNSSAFSTYNTGWRSGVTVPTNVQASDGTYSDKVVVTWSGTTGNYFRVYRNTTNNTSSATALGSWQTSTTYNDVSATPNVTYYYWVKAASDANGSNSSAFSTYNTGWRSGVTVTVPTNVQASDGTYSDKVVVTWNGTSGNYFRVFRNTTNNSGSATALGSWQTSTTYNDASATPNVTYYYWVKAASDANGSNSSAFSSYDTGWRGGVTVPTNVQASDGTYNDKVVVTWVGTSGNYFRVYRNTTNNSSTATALGSWQTATTYNDASATPNVTYYYWVKAASDANGSNSSAFSNYDTGWRSGVTVPTNVQASDGTYIDKVVVTWTGTSGNYFRVFRNTTNNSSSATALGSWQTSTTYNDISATPNVTYYYWVKAASDANGSNSSAFSNYDTGWRNGVTVPTNVQATDGTYNDKVVVTWAGTSGNYFRVFRNTTNNSSTATALGSWQTATTYNDVSATPDVTYYYWVKAASDANGSNSSAFSTYDTGWRHGVTLPTNIQASDGTYFDKVVVTWNGAAGNYFRVYRNTTNNSGSATALGSWQTSTTYNDVSATPNITYYYWVKAATDANGSNSSAFSSYDTGWRSGVTVPTNVQASDGTYNYKIVVTWNGASGNYFRVFRNTTNNSGSAIAMGNWQTSTTYNDFTATPLITYYYWVKAASDANGSNSSAFSSYDTGWRSGSSNIFPPNNDYAFTSPDFNILSINKKSIDNDFTTSNSHETSLIIYPSPVITDAALNLKYNSTADSEATVSIVDINGNIVKKVEIFVNVGENVFTMDSPEVPGLYICLIRLSNGELNACNFIVN